MIHIVSQSLSQIYGTSARKMYRVRQKVSRNIFFAAFYENRLKFQ